jgi:signal transduction histidine kinase
MSRDARPSSQAEDQPIEFEPERARRTLSGGVLLFRWVAFSWMLVLNVARPDSFRRPALAWAGIAAAGLWTAWQTKTRGSEHELAGTLWIDVALSMALILLSGLVVPEGGVQGPGLFYATAYPLSTALAWGAEAGLTGAIEVTVALGAALVLSRPLNGISLATMSRGQVLGMLNGVVNYLLAGGVAGVVAAHLDRSTAQLRSAIDEAVHARERSARLAERQSLARAIHDSVLQGLAHVRKRLKQLSAEPTVEGARLSEAEVRLAEEADALRALILQDPEEVPAGTVSLDRALRGLARRVKEPPVSVSAVGRIWMPAGTVDQLLRAVSQALDNVVEHAGATGAAIFANQEDGWLIVSVRDNGRGFRYDEELLRQEGKAGMLQSMRGRVQDMGGRMRVESAPGVGTEVEFRIPFDSREGA